MSTVTEQPPDAGMPARGGSLLRAEFHRFRSRRFLQVLLAMAVLGWLAAVVIAGSQVGVPDDGDYAQAQQRLEQEVAIQEGFRQECLADPDIPEEQCPPALTEADLQVEQFLDKAPFDFAATGQEGAIGFAAAAAVLGFLLGATWIGAEWATRSVVALLFWVPQRMKVMAAKLVVLVTGAALFGVLMQLGWLAMAGILDALAGTGDPLPAGFWGDLLPVQGRGVLLTVLTALLGFGLANLTRNTGAALGAGFVYFAVLETASHILRPSWEPWLLTNNAAGLIAPGGFAVPLPSAGPTGFTEYTITNLQAGLYLGAVSAVVVGIGLVLFARRDMH
jgi:hypothetical protein